MMRIAMFAKTANPAKMSSVVKRFNQFVSREGKPLETKEISNASVTFFRPEPGVELSWGIKGNTAFITFGEKTSQALVKVLPEQPWADKVAMGQAGSGQLDFAVLTESLTSAVSKGAGDAKFKMVIWPMVQQVLSRLDKLSLFAKVIPSGLMANVKLSLR